ncbi:hypothetical protein BUALT_Bualt01G0218600 [Buddleja alternifolia]|uniref:C3H1-type domain-containing protein n=1 Tax=Buddleja alternifolia TaxID=168488 RepID=A0AAV6YFK8_9LAMI|nr:hypothetical protein BUALT_Bualt01G0218600 [Buddleja alternifolia]
MEVRTVRKVSAYRGQPAKNQVCIYWLAGRCNRNPCRFMHRESPPPQSKQPQSAPPDDIHRKQSSKSTWKNPNHNFPRSGIVSTNEGGSFKSTSNQSTPQKVLDDTGRKISHMDRKMVNSEQKGLTTERSSVQKAQPKQCKYWLTGNCVQGEKCKDLHSWFSGSGFTMLAKLEGHSKAITGVTLPSGFDKLYSGGKDRFIRAWDCNSGQCVGSLSLDGEVGCLIAEGPWVLVGLPNTVKAWNLQSQAEFSVGGPVGLVNCIVIDNDMIFAGVEDGTILVWKWHPGTNIPEPAAMLKEHNGAVCSLIIGANRLYSASRDCTIKVWDLQNFQCVHTLRGHTRDVTSVLCWDIYLLSASLDNTLKVWSATENGTLEVVYEVKEDYGVNALCGIYDAENKPILLCSYKDNTVRLYDLPSFSERGRIFSKHDVQVIQVGSHGLFFTGDATGEISVWRLLEDPCATAS